MVDDSDGESERWWSERREEERENVWVRGRKRAKNVQTCRRREGWGEGGGGRNAEGSEWRSRSGEREAAACRRSSPGPQSKAMQRRDSTAEPL